MKKKLLAGFGRVDMTPGPGVPLSGYGNDDKRPAGNILDPLYATCLAFTDEDGDTVLVYTMDILYAPYWVRPIIAEAVGLDVEKIHISGTHSHAAPVRMADAPLPGSKGNVPEALDYLRNKLQPAVIQAAKDALADRKEARISITSTRTDRMNFVRRYLDEAGNLVVRGFSEHPKLVHESQADNLMQLVKLERQGGKDIILCNYQAHQTMTGGSAKFDVSADGCGAMRREMEKKTGCLFAYFTGACGNVVPSTRLDAERRFTNEQYIEYGQTLAQYAMDAADGYREIASGKVRTGHLRLDIDTNHSRDHLVDKILPIVQLWDETNDLKRCNALAQAIGLNSIYAAQSALGKAKLGKTQDIELDVVAVGDLAFVMAPYEMFDTNGMEIKDGSPFAMTVIATCANDVRSYIPSQLGFDHGGYECDRCEFVPGTGERLAQTYVHMLDELH